ncbi:hypothetical protein L9F63_019555, partial [Diploptera punctata]
VRNVSHSVPAGMNKPRLYSAPKYCVGLVCLGDHRRHSYMFLVIALLFKIHKVKVKMNFHFLKLIRRYHVMY